MKLITGFNINEEDFPAGNTNRDFTVIGATVVSAAVNAGKVKLTLKNAVIFDDTSNTIKVAYNQQK